jgi:hypothetical protein
MSNFELIDDYLTNRLGQEEKIAFEQQLLSDPALKGDVDMQRQVLAGIRQARAIELKSMLNRVPVGGATGLTVAKIAAGVAAIGITGTALYFYFSLGEKTIAPSPKTTTNVVKPAPAGTRSEKPGATEAPSPASRPSTTSVKTEKSPAHEQSKTKKQVAVTKPKIEAFNPSDELVDASDKKAEGTDDHLSRTPASHIVVDTDASHKNYHFHYQFVNDKLILYGSFDKSLYEILEINGEQKTVFLYYKDKYYLLSEKQKSIAPLEPINDPALLKKLKEYRGR